MSHIDFEEVHIENATDYSYSLPEIPFDVIDVALSLAAIVFMFQFIRSLR